VKGNLSVIGISKVIRILWFNEIYGLQSIVALRFIFIIFYNTLPLQLFKWHLKITKKSLAITAPLENYTI